MKSCSNLLKLTISILFDLEIYHLGTYHTENEIYKHMKLNTNHNIF